MFNRESLNHIDRWYQRVPEQKQHEVCCLLLGNKADLVNERQVSFEEGMGFAEKMGMDYREISAKDNNDKECFECVKNVLDCLIVKSGINNDDVTLLKTVKFKYGRNCFWSCLSQFFFNS